MLVFEKSISVDDTLIERGNRYGEFSAHAQLSYTLRTDIENHMALYNSVQFDNLPFYMQEALILICHKLARIANGDPFYIDNFTDIAGYSQLVINELNKGN